MIKGLKNFLHLAICIAILSFSNGCNSQTQAPSPAPIASPIDSCELLTRSELEAVIDLPLQKQQEEQDSNQLICSYSFGSDSTNEIVVYVNTHYLANRPNAKADFLSQLNSAGTTGDTIEITGAENAAYAPSLGMLYAVKGNTGLIVIVNNLADPQRKHIAQQIATVVLGKLP